MVCDGVVIAFEAPTFIERRVSREELNHIRNPRGRVLGDTSVAFAFTLTTNGRCIIGGTVRLDGAVVRIDAALEPCKTRAVRRHERKHVEASIKIGAELATALSNGTDPDAALDAATDALNVANRAIDSDEEYATFDRECRR